MTYPSYTAVTASAAPVNETTFLLCKPDAEEAHLSILQIVSEVGFQVQAKSFRITAAVALELAKMFPSVRRKRDAHRSHAGVLHGSGRLDTDGAAAAHHEEEAASNGHDDADLITSDHARSSSRLRIIDTDRPLRPRAGSRRVNQMMGLPGTSKNDTDSPPPSTVADPWSSGHDTCDEQRAGRGYEEMTAGEWLAANVQHLLRSGTCVALTLCAPNAVQRLVELVGPENPIVAQRVAPRSLRALFGTDLLHNAVYAAATLTDANAAIQTVFGYEPRYAVVEARAMASVSPDTKNGAATAPDERLTDIGDASARGERSAMRLSIDGAVNTRGGAHPPRSILRLPVAGSVGAAIGPTLGYRRGLPEPVTLSALLSPVSTAAASPSMSTRPTGLIGGARLAGALPLLSPTSDAVAGAGLSVSESTSSVALALVSAAQASSTGDVPVSTGTTGRVPALTASMVTGDMTSSVAESHAPRLPPPLAQPPHRAQPDVIALYEKVVHQQQLLRVREMDLLLREQALDQRAGRCGQDTGDRGAYRTPTGRPAGTQAVKGTLPSERPTLPRLADAVNATRSGLESDTNDLASYHPRVRARTREGGQMQLTSLLTSPTSANSVFFACAPSPSPGAAGAAAASSAPKVTRRTVTANAAAAKSTSAVVVDHADVLPLIQLAERRLALFRALDTDNVGSISQKEFVALCTRSPAIQPCHFDDEAAAARLVSRLVGSASSRVDYNSFSVALLHLLKQ